MHRDLVERAIGGDEAAFTALVREMADHLYAVAYRIVRDTGRAEDATQQAFLNMWRNLGRLRDPDRFDGWAYRLVVNACYAELRQRRRWIAPFAAADRNAAEPDTAVTVANRDELRRGFERISAEQRAAVVLHHYVGLTVPQIADALDIAPATVRSRLYYGMRGLRSAITADTSTSSVEGLA